MTDTDAQLAYRPGPGAEAAIATDRCGLNVRSEDGVTRFTYATAVFVLERAA